jgi:hypothetical protein
VETVFDARRGVFNRLFATATPLVTVVPDGSGFPPAQAPRGGPFLVQNIFTDFKRHDLGPGFYERNWDGTFQKQFLTRALWGVGNRASYGHDGRSISLTEVILRHGGEAQGSRDAFAALADPVRRNVLDFLESLVLFPPDDTASNLDPGDPSNPLFPQAGHEHQADGPVRRSLGQGVEEASAPLKGLAHGQPARGHVAPLGDAAGGPAHDDAASGSPVLADM